MATRPSPSWAPLLKLMAATSAAACCATSIMHVPHTAGAVVDEFDGEFDVNFPASGISTTNENSLFFPGSGISPVTCLFTFLQKKFTANLFHFFHCFFHFLQWKIHRPRSRAHLGQAGATAVFSEISDLTFSFSIPEMTAFAAPHGLVCRMPRSLALRGFACLF
jgi:hypothetical protein